MVNNDLYHHGVKGMHWGVRRYQNKDGSRINTSYNHTLTDTKGNILMTDKSQKPPSRDLRYWEANISAQKAKNEYRKNTPQYKQNLKDELSVMGNAFDKKYNSLSSINRLKTYSVATGLLGYGSVSMAMLDPNIIRKGVWLIGGALWMKNSLDYRYKYTVEREKPIIEIQK